MTFFIKFHSKLICFNCEGDNGSLRTFSLLTDPQAPQYWNVKCGSGAYLQDSVSCVTSPSNESYFFHSPTNSYQSNYVSEDFF